MTKDVPDNSLVVDVPAKVIGETNDYIATQKDHLESSPCFDESYYLTAGISTEQKSEMLELLNRSLDRKGFIV